MLAHLKALMSAEAAPAPEPASNVGQAVPPEPPVLIVRLLDTGLPQVQLSKGLGRPMALFLLEHAKLMLLTQPMDEARPTLVKPNGLDGLRQRMHG